MIPTNTIIMKSAKTDLGGRQQIRMESQPSVKLNNKLMEKIEVSPLTVDEFLVMEQFSQYLPRGKRKMKLNMPELRDELLSNKSLSSLTDSSGLRTGGLASMGVMDRVNPKKSTLEIKEMSQSTINIGIKNNNRVSSYANLNGGLNPNYTSFKNHFILY